MAISIVRLGLPRKADEGLRIGTVRRPPRGVAKNDFAKLDYYDVWLPILSPSPKLVSVGLAAKDDKAWKTFVRKYRAEMKQPDASRTLDLLAALSHHSNFAVGCYCENESRCHRSILRKLLSDRGAVLRGLILAFAMTLGQLTVSAHSVAIQERYSPLPDLRPAIKIYWTDSSLWTGVGLPKTTVTCEVPREATAPVTLLVSSSSGQFFVQTLSARICR